MLWGTLASGGMRLRKMHGYNRRAAHGVTGEPDRVTQPHFYNSRDTTGVEAQ